MSEKALRQPLQQLPGIHGNRYSSAFGDGVILEHGSSVVGREGAAGEARERGIGRGGGQKTVENSVCLHGPPVRPVTIISESQRASSLSSRHLKVLQIDESPWCSGAEWGYPTMSSHRG